MRDDFEGSPLKFPTMIQLTAKFTKHISSPACFGTFQT